jgi:hypothetical protein
MQNSSKLSFIATMSKFNSCTDMVEESAQGERVLLSGGVVDGGVMNMREYNKHARVCSGGGGEQDDILLIF